MHHGSAGASIAAKSMAEKIKRLVAKLNIGDDSLVGPGDTIWQQLAIGWAANWVEATEKENESDFYYNAVIKIPTESSKNPIDYDNRHYGFGIYLNEQELKDTAYRVVDIK